MLTRLKIDNLMDQTFIDSSQNKWISIIDIPKENIIANQKASIVATKSDSQLVVKIVKSRSWHEYVKYFWGRSRDFKEVKGNKLLDKIGLRVPEIVARGYGIFPGFRTSILGYYVMENWL